MIKNIGRFEVLSELGQGAMGEVYEVRDPAIDRLAAIKIVRNHMMDDQARARFQREARAAGRLSHPNIITVYELGEADGQPYIAMELLEGRDLGELVRAGIVLPLEQQVELMIQVAEGLDFAHKRGVVHRDIKPSNIFLGRDGSIKIMDFGIAKMDDAQLTRTGSVLGTVQYISPEQLDGKKVDGRTDQFSFGATFYQLITLRSAFAGATLSQLMLQILNSTPLPLTELDGTSHAWLKSVIFRCLEKNPERRFRDCKELADALRGQTTAARGLRRQHLPGARAPATQRGRKKTFRAADETRLGDHGDAAPSPSGTRWLVALVAVLAVAVAVVGALVARRSGLWSGPRAEVAPRLAIDGRTGNADREPSAAPPTPTLADPIVQPSPDRAPDTLPAVMPTPLGREPAVSASTPEPTPDSTPDPTPDPTPRLASSPAAAKRPTVLPTPSAKPTPDRTAQAARLVAEADGLSVRERIDKYRAALSIDPGSSRASAAIATLQRELLTRGDRAREQRDWEAAQEAYEQAGDVLDNQEVADRMQALGRARAEIRADAEVKAAWEQVRAAPTVAGLEAFVREHGSTSPEMRGAAETLLRTVKGNDAYEKATKSMDRSALSDYLAAYPDGTHRSEVERLIAKADKIAEDALAAAEREGTPAAFQRYLRQFPHARPDLIRRAEAKEREVRQADDEAFNQSRADGGRKALLRYLKAFPRGLHVAEVLDLLEAPKQGIWALKLMRLVAGRIKTVEEPKSPREAMDRLSQLKIVPCDGVWDEEARLGPDDFRCIAGIDPKSSDDDYVIDLPGFVERVRAALDARGG